MKRDDLIHEWVSGNKWRKLKYNLEECLRLRKNGLLTFGGAYSNHLLATAAVANRIGIKSIGMVRGDELSHDSNHLLAQCSKLGMELIFVSRSEYQAYKLQDKTQELEQTYQDYYVIPEGGANHLGILGCQEIVHEINLVSTVSIEHLFVAAGTTTTACGLAIGLKDDQKLHVVPVLKGFDTIQEMSNMLLLHVGNSLDVFDKLKQVEVHEDDHHGGYGKISNELLQFIEIFQEETHIALDYVYTGKAMQALFKWIDQNDVKNTAVGFVHTGGLVGGKYPRK